MPIRYSFKNSSFFIENYDRAKTFSSFLPGIAGVNGIPMWSFYVNRGQVMGSFGVRDKNGAIMEFLPANIMYRNIEHQGFRTFIRKDGDIHEIFSSASNDRNTRTLEIEKNIIRITEENKTLGLRITVTYFTMPGESYAALVRKTAVERLGSDDPGVIELLDGLTQILPYGVSYLQYQSMSNLSRSWFGVHNLENDIAYYRVRGTMADTTEVGETFSGNFYLSFSNESGGLIPPIYDMDIIFAHNTALTKPDGWVCSAGELHARRQAAENKVSGGFTGVRTTIAEKGGFILYTMIGHVSDPDIINSRKSDFTPCFMDGKEEEARKLLDDLTGDVFTKTADPLFDKYIEQCWLDNFLRGGYPAVFGKSGKGVSECGRSEAVVYHLFSRKHGDIEREYNFFSLEPSYYSQGNGNYRDVNQNRRNDVLIKPEVADFNVRHMMSLIQADGYNPLLVKGCTFKMDKCELEKLLKLVRTRKDKANSVLSSAFTPGRLITCIREQRIELEISEREFLERALAASQQEFEAEFGEGFWSDHWTYNMDLVETFLQIYPDREEGFLFENCAYRFFQSPVYVMPRSDKYVLVDGRVRQYGAVKQAGHGGNWLKTANGRIYETNLFVKLLSLAINKFVCLDPYGMGIEMEADRPGWNDAMNGLPGLFGSGLSETAELKRLIAFLSKACEHYDREISLFIEAAELMKKTVCLLDGNLDGELGDYEYWDGVSSLKEEYRTRVTDNIDGNEVTIGTKVMLGVLHKIDRKLQAGLDKAVSMGNGIYPTYFTYEAVEYKVIDGKTNPVNGYQNVNVTRFRCSMLPFFLEAPARMLKILPGADSTDVHCEAKELYDLVKSSDLYDKKLKMYKTSVPLKGASFEIGRLLAFTPGWLEREAIFMHMEYKYLYSVLKAGLYDEFFEDIGTMFVPFMKPEVYGRSTTENSSFIASSVNPDSGVHGRGFVARMTGTTAEMLTIWYLMMTGAGGFRYEEGRLSLSLAPVLPGSMFDGEGKVSFKFLGKTMVTYHNPSGKNTYGASGVKPVRYVLSTAENRGFEITGGIIPPLYAEMVRNGGIKTIDVYLDA